MNKMPFPTFLGTNAKIAADRYAQYHLATQLLYSVSAISDNVLGKLSKTYDPLELLEQGVIKPDEIPLNKQTLHNSNFLFILLCNIPGIGEKSADELVDRYKTLAKLADVPYEKLKDIPTIGKKRAKILSDYLDRMFG
jgi:Holliday junction resolvasome RuvABC DNA-binding subunit